MMRIVVPCWHLVHPALSVGQELRTITRNVAQSPDCQQFNIDIRRGQQVDERVCACFDHNLRVLSCARGNKVEGPGRFQLPKIVSS